MDVIGTALKVIDAAFEWRKMFILSLLILITGALSFFAEWPFWLAIGTALFICSMILLTFEILKERRSKQNLESFGKATISRCDNHIMNEAKKALERSKKKW